MSYIRFLFDDLRYKGLRADAADASEEDSETFGMSKREIEQVSSGFRTSSRRLSLNVFASAPVRTQPLRTYTPSELIASSEGSHVPLELARTKLRSPDKWRSIKQGLVSFGENAGLFTDIDIRQLGKSDIDPFQILVKVAGPTMNLVDVGYGISQVLPIVYQMQETSYSAFLLQQPEVHLHPRAQAELGSLFAQVVSRKDSPTIIVETHSDYIIDRVRIEISQGRLDHRNATIIFFEKDSHGTYVSNISFKTNGEIQHPPDNFRSFFIEEHARLLGL